MVSGLLITLIVVLYSFQTLFCRLYNDRYQGGEDVGPFVYCVFYGVFVTLFTLCVAGFGYAPSGYTVLLGVLNAFVLFGYNVSLIKATSLGSYAMANFCLLSGGILVPLVQSVLFYGSRFTALQYAGVAVMIAAFLALNLDDMMGKKEGTPRKKDYRFALFCALLFLFNGLYGGILYAQQEIMENTERTDMIITTFSMTALIGLIMVLRMRGRNALTSFQQTKISSVFLLLCCLSAASALNLLMYIMSFVDVAILYTVENGGVLLMSTLYAVCLFKEKMSPTKAVGVALAVASLVMLS